MLSRPQRLLGEALEFSWQKYPEKTAAIYKGEHYSFAQLYQKANNLASHLINTLQKIQPDHVNVFRQY